MNLITICHCHHDKASHFEAAHTCLAALCDCEEYVDRNAPLPPKPTPPQFVTPALVWCHDPDVHPAWCTCASGV